MRHAAIYERERKVRIDLYRVPVVGNSALRLLAEQVGVAAIVVGCCQMRIAGDRLGEEIYRFIEPSDPQEHELLCR